MINKAFIWGFIMSGLSGFGIATVEVGTHSNRRNYDLHSIHGSSYADANVL